MKGGLGVEWGMGAGNSSVTPVACTCGTREGGLPACVDKEEGPVVLRAGAGSTQGATLPPSLPPLTDYPQLRVNLTVEDGPAPSMAWGG